MDSWTDKQLALMKAGGNDKCNAYLKKHGIDARTPIKQKYESPVAQLYKEVLKARVEGRPEPTELPKPAPPRQSSSFGGSMSSAGSGGGAGDPNGMERLPGESDQQYIARQTRLREEARARMAAKFGGSGMGGVGSGGGGGGGGSRMQGIGSDPSYNPNSGYGGGRGGDLNVDALVSGFGSFATSMKNTVSSTISSTLTEENINAVKSTGASFWGSLTAGVSSVATNLTKPQEDDGLAQLQREVASHKPSQSKYGGFGSGQTSYSDNGPTTAAAPTPPRMPAANANMGGGGSSSSGTLQEAPGLPHEDRNGIERLTGESDEQYIMRQTRLRDEARARMAAKFGGGGMSSASSASSPAAPRTAPSSGNSPFTAPAPAAAAGARSAPSSGNMRSTKLATPKPINSDDFFSSFGT